MRPIDADYIKSKLNKAALGGHLHYYVCGVIDDAPTIDAEPVKHGEWVEIKFSEGVYIDNEESNDIGLSITSAKCSLCQKYSEQLQQYRPKMPAYCSHCGAKMDGGEGQ